MSVYLIAGGALLVMVLVAGIFRMVRRQDNGTVLMHFNFQEAKSQESIGRS